jgi:hypothetical protein
MSPHDVVEEVALLSLLAALAFSYVLDRVHLVYYSRHARKIVADLEAMEARLRAEAAAAEDGGAAIAQLSNLERRLTAASKRLIKWRASPVERFIIGSQIDSLLFQYERAGAMTTRLAAMIRVRTGYGRGREEAAVSARS